MSIIPHPIDARIGLLLLAAGSSTRMGDNKMLLEIDGETVLRRAAKVALAGGFDPVVVVTGHERDRVEAELTDLACEMTFNAEHEAGIHTSVRAGIAALPDDADAVVVMLADMPFVTEAMLADLVESYKTSETLLVISRYGGETKAPPILYDRPLFAELEAMEEEGGREVVRRHFHEALVVDWPAEALTDIDTPEDYERACARIAEGAASASDATDEAKAATET